MRLDSRYSPVMTVMVRAIQAAAKGLIRDFGELEKLQVSQKSLGDFVSSADLRSEKILVEALQKGRPKFGIISEEKASIEGTEPFSFIIDPLDGTSNFLHGIPQWCISIGLAETKPNGTKEVVAGVILDPIKDELFWAEKGKGAYINSMRLRVSGRRKLNESLIGCGFPALHNKEAHALFLAESEIMMQQVAGLRRMGSACLDLCYVAAGRFEGFFDYGLKSWDMAAGSLIVSEAGGVVTDYQGNKDYLETGGIIAGNHNIHPLILPLLQKAYKKTKAS